MTYPVIPPDVVSGQTLPATTVNALLDSTTQIIIDLGAVQSSIFTQSTNISTMQTSLTALQSTMTTLQASVQTLQSTINAAQAPGSPANLRGATTTTTTIGVAWDAVTSATSYVAEILIGTVWTPLAATATTSSLFSGLTAGTVYQIHVYALNGTVAGVACDPISLTTPAIPLIPAAPGNLRLTGATSTTITVSWDAVTGATSYQAGYLITGTWTSEVTTSTVSATFVGLTASTSYTIRVLASAAAVDGSLSSPLDVATLATGSAPSAPTGPTATNATANSIDFSWTAVAGGGTPPSDPGWSTPALTIAPSASRTFTNIALADTLYATNPGRQLVILYCDSGTLSVALNGTTAITSGSNNSPSMQFDGLFSELIATIAGITYRAPGADGSATINLEFWDSGGRQSTASIAVTITTGAATAETGGYNPVGGGITYIPKISGNAGSTYTSLSPVTGTSVTFVGLLASHSYVMKVAAVSALGVVGVDSSTATLSTTSSGGIVGDPTGLQAVRAADFVSTFGINIFPTSGQDGGDVSAEAAQFNYFHGSTGHKIIARSYSFQTGDGQAPALVALNAATGCFVAPCIGHYQSSNDPSGVVAIVNAMPAGTVVYAEGNNEPNTPDFGSLSAAQVQTSQQSLYNSVHPGGNKVAAASVVGDSVAQSNFYGGTLAAQKAASDYATCHLYPNNGCGSAANQMRDWVASLSTLWAGKPVMMTEYHPTLFNTTYAKANSETISGYYSLCSWVNGYFDYNMRGFVWFCMNNYSPPFNPVVGLFATNATNPHLAAKQIKAFIYLLTDTGGTKRTFTPGKLAVTAVNLPAGNHLLAGGRMPGVIQTSNGDFWVPIYNEQDQYSGSSQPVTLNFGGNALLVEDYLVANATQSSVTPTPRSSWSNVSSVTFQLGTEFRLIRVRKQ